VVGRLAEFERTAEKNQVGGVGRGLCCSLGGLADYDDSG
jgi:hypothetical protein